MSDAFQAAPLDPRFRFGYVPNPAATARFCSELAARNGGGGANLFAAAPHFQGDGLTGDLMPYLALYQVEILDPDGSTWKAEADEPPYIAQTGQNCTSEGTARALDALQVLAAAAAKDGTVVHRTCIEATYAFGLAQAGLRGDNGCYGSAMAAAVQKTGAVDYATVGAPYDEDGSRLASFASNPTAVVREYAAQAARYQTGEAVQITTREEACAWFANGGVIIACSDVGYQSLRDSRGICARNGSWSHCMMQWGVIRSDGIESVVQFQSWGPGNVCGQEQPSLIGGTQPYNLPSYAFRVSMADAESQYAAGDTWGLRSFPGFEKAPLPPQFTNAGWMG